MTNAERQRRYRERRAAGEPVRTFQRPKDRRRPRPKRWTDAVAELRTLQAEYETWRDQLPEAPGAGAVPRRETRHVQKAFGRARHGQRRDRPAHGGLGAPARSWRNLYLCSVSAAQSPSRIGECRDPGQSSLCQTEGVLADVQTCRRLRSDGALSRDWWFRSAAGVRPFEQMLEVVPKPGPDPLADARFGSGDGTEPLRIIVVARRCSAAAGPPTCSWGRHLVHPSHHRAGPVGAVSWSFFAGSDSSNARTRAASGRALRNFWGMVPGKRAVFVLHVAAYIRGPTASRYPHGRVRARYGSLPNTDGGI